MASSAYLAATNPWDSASWECEARQDDWQWHAGLPSSSWSASGAQADWPLWGEPWSPWQWLVIQQQAASPLTAALDELKQEIKVLQEASRLKVREMPGSRIGCWLEAVEGEDPDTVLVISSIRGLGREPRPKILLKEHFSRWGEVKRVVTSDYVAIKTEKLPNGTKRVLESRVRPGGIAFLVMTTAAAARSILDESEHVVAGSRVGVRKFSAPSQEHRPARISSEDEQEVSAARRERSCVHSSTLGVRKLCASAQSRDHGHARILHGDEQEAQEILAAPKGIRHADTSIPGSCRRWLNSSSRCYGGLSDGA